LKPLAEYSDNNNLNLTAASGNEYYLSFCNFLPSENSCNAETMATVYYTNNTCTYLSGNELQDDFTFTYVDASGDNSEHVKISYGDAYPGYNLTVEIFCSSDNTFENYTIDESNLSAPYIAIYSSTGCATDAFWTWVLNNKWVMFSLSLVIGFILCFFGRKLWKPLFFLSGVLFTVFIILILFYTTFLNNKTESWVGWVVVAGSVLLGLIVGYIFMKISKLGAFVLAGWGGFCLGLLIWNSFLYLASTSNVLFWLFTVGVGVVTGILALVFFDHIIILTSAIAGSYVFVAGIGLVAGRWTNPF
jgi:hypothetical protein